MGGGIFYCLGLGAETHTASCHSEAVAWQDPAAGAFLVAPVQVSVRSTTSFSPRNRRAHSRHEHANPTLGFGVLAILGVGR